MRTIVALLALCSAANAQTAVDLSPSERTQFCIAAEQAARSGEFTSVPTDDLERRVCALAEVSTLSTHPGCKTALETIYQVIKARFNKTNPVEIQVDCNLPQNARDFRYELRFH